MRLATLPGCLLAAASLTVPLLALPSAAAAPAAAATRADDVEPIVYSADDATLALAPLGTYRSGVFDASAAEIVRFHAGTQRLFVVNAESGAIDVLDAADPTTPTKLDTLTTSDLPDLPEGTSTNSVAVRPDGLVVAAVEAPVKTDPGWLAFADAQTLEWLGAVQVGAVPDMVGVTDDGERAVVAVEGEPADDFGVDPEGGIGVVDLPTSLDAPGQDDVRIADFHDFEEGGTKPLPDGVRVFGPVLDEERRVSTNLEPEYVAFDADGVTAYATLQEANAVAVVDLDDAEVTEIWPLQLKDHTQPGMGLDPSDRDGAIAIGSHPVHGIPMPDGVESFVADGTTYLVTANEGDAREWGDYVEPARVKDLGEGDAPPLCEGALTAEQRSDAQLGRLNVSTASGLSDDGTCVEQLHSFGSRSFSVWTTDGELVFDSGEDFEQITAAAAEDHFNSNHTASDLEGRSDDKGPEPENLAVGEVGGRTYAFIGFERVGGIAVYDLTSPAEASFVTYVNRRDFAVSVEDAEDPQAVLDQAGDLGPEGLEFVPAADSPTGEPMLAVGNEVSGTTTVFGITDLLEAPATTLAVRGVPAQGRYGVVRDAVVQVSFADDPAGTPEGIVELSVDGESARSVPTEDGVATLRLPRRLLPGRHELEFAFVPADDAEAAPVSDTRTLRVLRARTTTSTRVSSTPGPRRTGTVVVRVGGRGGALASDDGQVRVRFAGDLLRAEVRAGRAVVRLPRTPPGTYALRARFAGSPTHRGSAAGSRTVRVG